MSKSAIRAGDRAFAFDRPPQPKTKLPPLRPARRAVARLHGEDAIWYNVVVFRRENSLKTRKKSGTLFPSVLRSQS